MLKQMLVDCGQRLAGLFGEPNMGFQGTDLKGVDEISKLFKQNPLAAMLPYESYEPDSQIFTNHNSCGFVIEALPMTGADAAMQREISSLIEDLAQEGSCLQFLLWADHRTGPFMNAWSEARVRSNPVLQRMSKQRVKHLQDGSAGEIRQYRLIISYSVPGSLTPELSTHLEVTRAKILKALQAFTHAHAWSAQNFIDAVGALCHFSFDREERKRRYNGYQDISSQLSQGGLLNVTDRDLTWKGDGSASFRSYRVTDYPDHWNLAAMQHLIGDLLRDSFRLQTPFMLHYAVHIPHQEEAESQLRIKSQFVENQGKSSLLMRMIPALVDEIQEHDSARRKIHEGSRIVWAQLSAGIWSPPSELDQHEQVLMGLMRIHQFRLVENRCLHLPHFLSILPMSWGEYYKDLRELSVTKTTLSDECSNFLPMQGEWMGTSSPGMLLVGRRGQVINWNPFDNRSGNYNTIVVGRSGSGKSVFMQDLLLSGLGVGHKVFILEVGRSFEKMCDCLDGQHIEFSSESELCLNPFSLIPNQDKSAELENLSMLRSTLSCMASPSEGTSDLENSLLDKAIRRAWSEHGNLTTVTHVAQRLNRMNEDSASRLAHLLGPYCKDGIYARYFEGKNNVDFTSPMVCIELEELKEKKDLQAVVIQLFIMTITNQAFLGDRQTPFYICIDEAWDLLRGPQTGVFIETLARRLRKYNGSLVIGTQSVDDFFASPGAQAAFENSDWMCLLAQKSSSIHRLSESGKVPMTPSMKDALSSVTTRHGEFSELMICDADGHYAIARLILDPYSDLLYSTKADDYSRIISLRQTGMDTNEAIQTVLMEKSNV